jgi:hypothetical protein
MVAGAPRQRWASAPARRRAGGGLRSGRARLRRRLERIVLAFEVAARIERQLADQLTLGVDRTNAASLRSNFLCVPSLGLSYADDFARLRTFVERDQATITAASGGGTWLGGRRRLGLQAANLKHCERGTAMILVLRTFSASRSWAFAPRYVRTPNVSAGSLTRPPRLRPMRRCCSSWSNGLPALGNVRSRNSEDRCSPPPRSRRRSRQPSARPRVAWLQTVLAPVVALDELPPALAA